MLMETQDKVQAAGSCRQRGVRATSSSRSGVITPPRAPECDFPVIILEEKPAYFCKGLCHLESCYKFELEKGTLILG